MKMLLVALSLVGLVLFSGCAHDRRNLVLAPVGPAPPVTQPPETTGTLVVYSALEVGAHFYDPPYKHRHTDYKIFLPDGKLLQKVHNDNETVMEGPVWVPLPAGNYRVIAWAGKSGDVTVPVVIRARQVTTVHLENGVN